MNERDYLGRLEGYLGARYSQHTINAFIRQSRAFLIHTGVKPRYTRADLLAYLDHLIRSGYKPQSILVMMHGVRALFRALELSWPLDRRDMHLGLPESDKEAPVMPAADVVALIRGAQLARPLDRAICCLSTVYGLRNSELALVVSQGLDGRVLEVQTSKLGRKRVHLIPRGLAPILTMRPQALSRDTVHKIFDRLMSEHVRRSGAQEGWHSVRRSVVTGLLQNKIPLEKVHYFMGWKLSGTAWIYYHPEPGEVETEVYQGHPFLRHWFTSLSGQTTP